MSVQLSTHLRKPEISIADVEASSPQVIGSFPPFEEVVAPMCNQVFQEQIVAGVTTQNKVESLAVQEQVIVQENSQIQVMERIHEQIVDITGLVNPQCSSTSEEASAPQVFVLLPLFEEFDAPVYFQVHQEQIVAGEMTLNIVQNPAVQEQVIVQEIP